MGLQMKHADVCAPWPDWRFLLPPSVFISIYASPGFGWFGSKRFTASTRQTTRLHSVLTFRAPTHGNTHSVQVVFLQPWQKKTAPKWGLR